MAKAYGDRWKVVSPISAGGQGDVYRVTDATGELAGEWALKRLRRKDRIARFRVEDAAPAAPEPPPAAAAQQPPAPPASQPEPVAAAEPEELQSEAEVEAEEDLV